MAIFTTVLLKLYSGLTLMKYLILLRLPASLVTWWPKTFLSDTIGPRHARCVLCAFATKTQVRLRVRAFVACLWISLRPLCRVRSGRTLIRLRWVVGWSGPLLVACGLTTISPVAAHFNYTSNLKPALLYYSAVSCTSKICHVANIHELYGMTLHFISLILTLIYCLLRTQIGSWKSAQSDKSLPLLWKKKTRMDCADVQAFDV